jgi:type VI secretion system protein ImpE
MAQADELLQSGDLAGARAALIDRVRNAPDDQAARMFLFQLQALLGEWDKASAQLRALAQLSPEAQMLAAVYSLAIQAEKTRALAFAGQGEFPVLVASSPWVDSAAQALSALAQGRTAEGEALRDEAFAAAPDTPGRFNDDKTFLWVADADPRFGPCFEAMVSGRWGLIPIEAISEIRCDGPTDLRDLVWLPVEMTLRSGQGVAGFLPARYPGSETAENTAVRMSRATEWVEAEAGQIGLGQRLLAFDDGSDADLLSLRRLTMAG